MTTAVHDNALSFFLAAFLRLLRSHTVISLEPQCWVKPQCRHTKPVATRTNRDRTVAQTPAPLHAQISAPPDNYLFACTSPAVTASPLFSSRSLTPPPFCALL
ncbi:hypothetical protein E2542_SST31479 [Spatholobus suberectus]|nr:hypothetical protein E2542_SST31479 [Spatholobus suberectus]